MITASALVVTLFFGGWMFPGWSSEFMRSHQILQGALMVGKQGAAHLKPTPVRSSCRSGRAGCGARASYSTH